jgi:hypothetical protein
VGSANSSRKLFSKKTRAKWIGGVPQMIECLLCMFEALSSNSVPPKNPQKQIKEKNQSNPR